MVGKAVVLAAGFGNRLRPFTATVPKPLLPVWGEPMLSRIVRTLRAKGVEDITVNCHHLADKIESWCRDNGCRTSRENEILGTGGALNPLRDWIGGDEFYLVNGDIVLDGAEDIDFESALNAKPLAGTSTIAAAFAVTEGPRTIEVEPDSSLVTNWSALDPGDRGTFTYAGFALLKPEILEYVKPDGFSTIVEAYEKAMMDGKFVKTVSSGKILWTDAGTVESYMSVNKSGEDNAFADIPHVKAFGADRAEFLGARGSDRAFFRTDKGIVVVYDDAKRPENAKYASHARHLAGHGVDVAKVIDEKPELKSLLMEDAGEDDLASIAEESKEEKLSSYAKTVGALARFASAPVPADAESAFGPDMWRWERELFRKYCLDARYSMEMPPEAEKELEAVAAELDKEPKALVHRDFQSTNVFFKNGKPKIIDYQGMREGPSVYDLASLLFDPYVKLTAEERKTLAGERATKIFYMAAVERLVQCLGAYGRLASVGQPQFGKWVPPALSNLREAAGEAGLEAVAALAGELLSRESAE